MEKLRIGMVVHAYYRRDARVIRYGETLAKAGYDVTVVCLKDPKEPEVEVVNGVTIYRVKFERRRGGKIWYIWEYIWAFLLFTLKFSRLELKHHFDIVHVHNMPDFLVFTGLLSRLRGAKIILDLHDPMPELFMSKFDLEDGWIIKLLKIQERISLVFAQALITVDTSFQEMFERRGIRSSKFTIVRNMPDYRFFLPREQLNHVAAEQADNFTLIYAGTIAERYQLDNVIKAVAKAHRREPKVRLKVVGKLDQEGDYAKKLRDIISRENLQDVVELHPPVLLDEIPNLLQDAQVGLEPSRRDPYTEYVLPLKLLEASAMKVPSLVSRRPTIERYFSDDMVEYFEADSIDELADAIVKLINNPERLTELADKAYAIFETYNWDKETESYFGLLQQLARKKA
ncbi:MAG: glycosyltransferase family 4 protein [Aggregatilineales bacterium]